MVPLGRPWLPRLWPSLGNEICLLKCSTALVSGAATTREFPPLRARRQRAANLQPFAATVFQDAATFDQKGLNRTAPSQLGSLSDQLNPVDPSRQDSSPGTSKYLRMMLAFNAVGSWLHSRRDAQMASRLESTDVEKLLKATLHGLSAGLLVVDALGLVTFANDEAVRLLDLPHGSVGCRLIDLDLTPQLCDLLGGEGRGINQAVTRVGRGLVLHRQPLAIAGKGFGAITTLHDRTETDDLLRDLAFARTVTEALQSHAHEFANRMHTVAGLLELAEYEEALHFLRGTAVGTDRLVDRLIDQVGDPAVVALLRSKADVAAAAGKILRISSKTHLPSVSGVDGRALLTVLGNLVDNALEALGGTPGWVEVLLAAEPDGVLIEVRDSGPGVEPALIEEIFSHGFTTKASPHIGAHGLGLALTRAACVSRGGWVRVHNDCGAVFTALLPYDCLRDKLSPDDRTPKR